MGKKSDTLNEIISDVRLSGLVMPHGDEYGSYFESLPDHFSLCSDFRDFYRLKKGKRAFVKENYEINEGMQYIVYSPYSKRFYFHILHEANNMNRILSYFTDKNLYIVKETAREEAPAEETIVDEKEDSILF